jgi:ATP-binding cassette, subfamily B, bacterial PglK
MKILSITDSLKELISYLSEKRKKQILIFIILTIFTSMMEMLSVAAVVPFIQSLTNPDYTGKNLFFYDLILINNKKDLLLVTSLLFASISGLTALLRCILVYFTAKLSNMITAELSIKIYKSKLYEPYSKFISQSSNIIISAVTEKINQIYSFLNSVVNIVSGIFILIGLTLILLWINIMATVFSLGFFGILYFVIILLSKKTLKRNSQIINYEQNKIILSLQNGLGSIRDIILDKTHEFYISTFSKSNFNKAKRKSIGEVIAFAPRYIFEGMAVILVVLLILLYGMKSQINIDDFTIFFPTLAALALGSQKMIPLLNSLFANLSNMRQSVFQIAEVIDILNEDMKKDRETSCKKNEIYFEKYIVFKNIFFSYEKNKKYIFEDINLKIKKGSRVGIIGKTGEGKSTFLDLLMGLLEPVNGSILIDSTKLSQETNDSWQSKISHVPQKIFLSDDTYLANIAFGKSTEKIDYRKVILAAKKAQINNFIIKNKDGYDERVGERGVKLSGGQIQRLGLARALYKNSEIIIFDEATNSLDSNTESLIMEEVYGLDKNLTVIIVAHRLNTLQHCDTIYEIKDKKVNKIK